MLERIWDNGANSCYNCFILYDIENGDFFSKTMNTCFGGMTETQGKVKSQLNNNQAKDAIFDEIEKILKIKS